ncbi:MAG: AEC family transporter [Oscillospiraceae bacterium]|nr:AEC family transporter [Oscillospiraceae bacterium]
MDYTALLNKMVIFVVLMLIGYLLAKRGVIDRAFTRMASSLVINVFMVGTILNSMLSSEIGTNLTDVLHVLLVTSVVQIIGFVFAFIVTRFIRLEDGRAAVYELLMALGNTMFIGLPIAEALYGARAVFVMSISCIPFNVLLYSYGVWRLQGGGSGKSLRLKDVFSLPLVATIVGILLLIGNIPVPAALKGTFSALSGATMPVSMLVIGANLSTVSLLDAFRSWQLALASAVKLLIVPVLGWLVCRWMTTEEALLMTAVIIAACPSAVMVSVLGIQYGQDGLFSAEGVQHSTICSLVTIPLLLSLLSGA